jgi:hypothetical protein
MVVPPPGPLANGASATSAALPVWWETAGGGWALALNGHPAAEPRTVVCGSASASEWSQWMRNEPEYQMALAFQEAWADPTPESLIKLLHRETVLYQPHLPPIRGIGNALREFQLFLEWLPRFRGEVHGFVGEHNVLFIEWTMLFPLGRKDLRVRAIDRITLRDGLIHVRAVYFNTLPLVKQIMRTPGGWPGYWKYRTSKRHTS